MIAETKQCDGTNIYVLRNILSQEQCDYFIKEFSEVSEMQIIKQLPETSDKLWSFIGGKLSEIEFMDERRGRKFRITSLKAHVSITKAIFGVGRHIDEQFGGDIFKMFFYLNKLSANGGTNFYESPDADAKVSVQNEAGAGVLFDIGLEHSSQPFPSGEIKYVMV
jgi:hypothetical protein